jgi:hypothetical protein
MRRLALILLVAGLPLGGCVDALLGIECEDDCVHEQRTCNGDEAMLCKLNLWVSNCTWWDLYEDCGDRGALCVDGYCVCPAGLADCGTCVDLATDPNNCGDCDFRCTGACLNGTCAP